MKKFIISVLFAIMTCIFCNAQVNYGAKGMSYVAIGDYVAAKEQFEAQRSVLDVKKVNKNSEEYIKVEKRIAYAQECIPLSKTAKQKLAELEESLLQEAFVQCSTEDEAESLKNTLMAKLESARNSLNGITRRFSGDKSAFANLQKCDTIEVQILKLRSNFTEVMAWKDVLEYPTLEAYQGFLVSFPDGGYASAAKARIREFEDNALWKVYVDSQTYENCKAYLTAFPDGLHVEQAQNDFIVLEENWYWESAKDREGLLQYMSKYPDGRYFTEASDKVKHMDDMDSWYEANTVNTIYAYEKYLRNYPEGYYTVPAKNAIDKIKDKEDWDKAVTLDTKEAYREYLNSSPLMAYRDEAESRIADLEHLENVSADKARWESIKDSTDPQVFHNYINDDTPYKDPANLNEANFNYNLFKAKDLYTLHGDSQKILSYFNAALLHKDLPAEFEVMYDEINEKVLYDKFMAASNESNADAYLSQYSVRASEINHKMCMLIADSMTISSSLERLKESAMKYAKNQKDIDYVEDRYQAYKKQQDKMNKKLQKQAAAEAKKAEAEAERAKKALATASPSVSRSSSSVTSTSSSTTRPTSTTSTSSVTKSPSVKASSVKEPLHMIFGLEGASTYEGDHLMLTPLLSLGGHSNRINLEFGYTLNVGFISEEELSFLDPTVVVRPRWNIVKEKYKGGSGTKRKAKDYSNFYMYIAPEVHLDPVKLSNKDYTSMMCDYGARFGIGLAPFDFFVGYSVNRGSTYCGVTLYLSRK